MPIRHCQTREDKVSLIRVLSTRIEKEKNTYSTEESNGCDPESFRHDFTCHSDGGGEQGPDGDANNDQCYYMTNETMRPGPSIGTPLPVALTETKGAR